MSLLGCIHFSSVPVFVKQQKTKCAAMETPVLRLELMNHIRFYCDSFAKMTNILLNLHQSYNCITYYKKTWIINLHIVWSCSVCTNFHSSFAWNWNLPDYQATVKRTKLELCTFWSTSMQRQKEPKGKKKKNTPQVLNDLYSLGSISLLTLLNSYRQVLWALTQ